MQTKLYRKAGENITSRGHNIDGWIYAGSGTPVHKIGRSTGYTKGQVSAGVVITWQDGRKTIELSVAIPQGQADHRYKFANGGDSGALIYTEADPGQCQCKAVGLLHGRSLEEGDLAVYTPMWAVMEMVAQGMGGGLEVFAGVDRYSTKIDNSE